MEVTIVANPTAPHQLRHAAALAAGFARHGVRTRTTHDARQAGQTVVVWGWHLGKPLRDAGKSVLVMERGYIGDRLGAWTSLAWNGLNNRGKVSSIPDDGGARFRAHFDGMLKPWNPAGEYVLLVGQVPGDASLQGRDLSPWYAAQAARPWGKPVVFRPHPVARKRGHLVRPVPGTRMEEGDLEQALAGAAEVVTWNSNTGVEALLAGKPTHVADPGSMAWEGAADRERWAYRLAWRQWTLEEFASGFALEHVGLTHG